MESYKDLQRRFFSGDLPEAEVKKMMEIYENLKSEDKHQIKSKPNAKHLDPSQEIIDPGILPVTRDEGFLPVTRDEGFLPVTKDADSSQDTSKSGLDALALKPTKFYVDKIGLSSSDFIKPLKLYTENGQYNYEGETYLEDFEEKIDYHCGNTYYYIGQVKKVTDNRDGVGITVIENGDIHEGYYNNDKRNGPGRIIGSDGSYYVGEWMADNFHGYGEWHYADGTVYKGQWIKGWMHGKGTMYYLNGTRRTGEWQDGDFKG